MNLKVIFSIIWGFTVLVSLISCSDEPEDEISRLNRNLDNR